MRAGKCLVLCFVLLGGFNLWAQTEAQITGTVTDASGAAIPGAKVSVSNEGTHGLRVVSSNSAGVYDVPALIPGNYSVSVEVQGFQTEVRTGVVLQVQESARLDFQMKVGQVTQRIEVAASAIQLNTENATVGSVVENQRIVDLPLNGRNFLQLVSLDANVNVGFGSGTTEGPRLGGNRSVQNISVAGGRSVFNYFTLDGVSNTDVSWNSYTFLPSVDALQEFKIESGVFPAEFGRGISQINVSTKPGTNDFHGALYEFVRNSSTDAQNYCFVASCPPGAILHQNQFGGTIGGPVWIPHVVDGKNKLFFMFNYEGYRYSQGVTETGTVATLAERQGDFTGLNPIYDPASQAQVGSVVTASSFASKCGGANMIPNGTNCSGLPSRIDPISAQLLAFEVLPNASGATNRVSVLNSTQTNNEYTIRADYNQSTNATWFGRYSWSNEVGVTPTSTNIVNTDKIASNAKQFVLSNVRTFSPTLVNDFRFGYNRLINGVLQWNAYTGTNEVGALGGLPGIATAYPAIYGVPVVSITGLSVWGDDANDPFLVWDNTFQWADTVSKIHGKHSIRLGTDIRREQFNTAGNSYIRGGYTVNGQATQNPASRSGTGVPFADFILGVPTQTDGAGALAQTEMRSTSQVYFIDDAWKATPKLTVSIGMRYDYFPAYWEKHDNIANVKLPAPNSGNQPIFVRPGTGDFYANAPTNFVFASDIQVARSSSILGRALQTNGNKNFAPRLGLAYSPTAKWVVRAGFGMFFIQDAQNINFDMGRNLAARRQSVSTQTFPNITMARPFGGAGSFPVSQPFVLAQQAEMSSPYMYQYLLDIQRQLTSTLMVEVGYIGSAGHKIWGFLDYNTPAHLGPGSLGDVSGSLRPWPELGVIQETSPWVNTNYNALTARISQKLSHGLSLNESYTWGRSIDDLSSIRSNSGDQQFVQNFYNAFADRAVSNFSAQQRSVTSLLYDLPVGKGRAWLDTGGAANAVLGGWEFGSILSLQTGYPIDIFSGCDCANSGENGYERPNYITGQSLTLPNPSTTLWFNTAAFVQPPAYTFGSLGRNAIIQPGVKVLDLALMKRFVIREGKYFQLRFEGFNAPNHPNWGSPNNTLTSSTFGRITSTRTSMRQLQFALKFVF